MSGLTGANLTPPTLTLQPGSTLDAGENFELIIGGNTQATINNAVAMNFGQSSGITIQDAGTLMVNGTDENPVTFTSPTKTAGSWAGLSFNHYNQCVFNHAIVEYAVNGLDLQNNAFVQLNNVKVRRNLTGIRNNASRCDITESSINDNDQAGLDVSNGGQGYVSCSEITRNDIGVKTVGTGSVVYMGNWDMTGGNNNIYDNTGYQLYLAQDATIEAHNCWWLTANAYELRNEIYQNGAHQLRVSTNGIVNLILSPGSSSIAVQSETLRLNKNDCAQFSSISGGSIASNTTWEDDIYLLNSITIPNGLTLTIDPGTTVDMAEDAQILVEAGGSLVIGAENGDPVTINGNGIVANEATVEAWHTTFSAPGGIGVELDGSYGTFENCNFIDSNTHLVSSNLSYAIARNCQFTGGTTGVSVNKGSRIIAENNTLSQQGTTAYLISDSILEITGNHISDCNKGFDIKYSDSKKNFIVETVIENCYIALTCYASHLNFGSAAYANRHNTLIDNTFGAII